MELSAKVVIIGAVGVGKSSLAIRYVHDQYKSSMGSTLGAIFYEKTNTLHEKKVKFEFWDTAGQQKYKAVARIYYKDCKVALVVYDVTNRDSFEDLKMWVQQLKQNGPEDVLLVIVGNKIDLQSTNSVTFQEATSYAKAQGAIFRYTSAKEDKGISELFNLITQKLLQREDLARKKKTNVKKSVRKQKGCC